MPNWKTPGHDIIYGFWFMKFTSRPDRLALKRSSCQQEAQVPELMTKRKTILIQKDSSKEPSQTTTDPLRAYIQMSRKLTVYIKEEIYDSLKSYILFPEKRKYATNDPEAQLSYSTLISISSIRARRNEQI